MWLGFIVVNSFNRIIVAGALAAQVESSIAVEVEVIITATEHYSHRRLQPK